MEGVARALQAVFILLIVGTIIGSWIAGGIIPALIYYSLKVLAPTIFVPALPALLPQSFLWRQVLPFTSLATVGLALMATGVSMGFPAPLVAGAVISGAYFGDKLSPLSDTTNLAPAYGRLYPFRTHRTYVMDTIPALLGSLVLYYFFGIKYASSSSGPARKNWKYS